MKCTVLQENLLRVVQEVGRFVPTKSPTPVLTSIIIKAEKGKISFLATDLQTGIQESIGGDIERDGEVAVPARPFIEYLSTLSPGKIVLEFADSELKIQSTHALAQFQTVPTQDFPPFPAHDDEGIKVGKDELVSLIEKGGIAAGIDETRPVFSSILLEGDGEMLRGVSTDGYRLAKKEVKLSGWKYDKTLVPAKAVREIVRIIARIKEKNVKIAVSEKLGQVFFVCGELLCTIRLTEANFPDYAAIIPQEFDEKIRFKKDEFLSALKTALVFSRDSSGIVKIELQKNQLTLRASSGSVGKNEVTVEIVREKGEGSSISFNGKYLLDLLSSVEGEDVSFWMNESLKPGMFTVAGEENFLYLVMPFRMQGEN